MKTTVLALIATMFFTACNAQESSEKQSKNSSLKNTPKESWTVNKELDENGNIIRYDSTYTWTYTNMDGDSVSVKMDSVLKSFNSYFNQQFPTAFGPSFMNPIWNDTLLQHDFFRDDFFKNRWEQDFYNMDEVFHQMDSLRNLFFKDRYPGLMESTKKQAKKQSK
ncbi:MAG: hypothetical protein DWP98_14165 [Bacteroidetes bacterium]|nr:MAG: hypothetical protein DWP98_14165 [Bacteroidota bacterium]MBL1145361.1 hypothetical protein [Bacteroidota bacterium]NOG58159.1 hypothetical protein [Bacteroidota bacterium]